MFVAAAYAFAVKTGAAAGGGIGGAEGGGVAGGGVMLLTLCVAVMTDTRPAGRGASSSGGIARTTALPPTGDASTLTTFPATSLRSLSTIFVARLRRLCNFAFLSSP